MSVSDHNSVQFTSFNLGFAPVLRALFFAALKKAAVDKNARVFSYNLIGRTSYVSGGSKETYFHELSFIIRNFRNVTTANAMQLSLACQSHTRARTDDKRSAYF